MSRSVSKYLLVFSVFVLMFSCSKEDYTPEQEPVVNKENTIAYTVTVREGASTRASLNGNSYIFQEGDKLYVTGDNDNVHGVLDLTAGAGTGSATFTGDLSYPSGSEPDPKLKLNATLVSVNDKIHDITSRTGFVSATTYPTSVNALASSLEEAVEWYSDFTGEGEYSKKIFTLHQNSAFIAFNLTFAEATGIRNSEASINVDVIPNAFSSSRRSGTVTKASSSDNVSFVAAFEGDIYLLAYDNLVVSWTGGSGTVTKEYSFKSSTTLEANKKSTFARTVADADGSDWFTIEAIENGTEIKLKKPKGDKFTGEGKIEYKKEGVADWTSFVFEDNVQTIATLAAGEKLYMRGTYSCYQQALNPGTPVLQFTKPCYAYGDMMYMLGTKDDSGNFVAKGTDIQAEGFNRFFFNNVNLKSRDGRDKGEVKKLTIGSIGGTLYRSACKQMFDGCASLTIAPVLLSKTIDNEPETQTHYSGMFQNCSKLEIAPLINITTPGTNTYGNMFQKCTSLQFIRCTSTSKSNNNFATTWVVGVPENVGVFVISKDAPNNFWNGKYPSGWTVIKE